MSKTEKGEAVNLISFMSDFGLRDNYVGVVKGIMMNINPDLRIVDISHGIAPFATGEANYLISTAYHYFPKETVHLVVVDPGVGTDRAALILRSASHYFVGPDNGIFTNLIQHEGVKCYEIRREAVNTIAGINRGPARTFDGRDLFAPAAAWLTRRQSFSSYGRACGEYSTFPVAVPRWDQMTLVGEVEYVDRFGNLITNLTTEHVKEVQEVTRRPNPSIRLREYLINGLVGCYGEGDGMCPHALLNSNGQVEIFLKESSAADHLNVGCHESVKMS